MKSPCRFAFALILLLCGCHEKTAAPAPVLVAMPGSATPAPLIIPTPMQLASVLRVRVALGGFPPQDSIGALLRASEISDQSLVRSDCRFVLAPLTGWTEAQLRSPATHLIVYRNKVNADGERVQQAFLASLAQFDSSTGMAVLAYMDDFAYSMDAGFSIRHTGPTPAGLALLRVSWNAGGPLPVPHETQTGIKPFSVDTGSCSGSPGTAIFQELGTNLTADSTTLALSGSDQLAGFAEITSNGRATLTPLNRFAVAITKPAIDIADVAFTPNGEPQWGISIKVTGAPNERLPQQMQLLVSNLSYDAPREVPKPTHDGSYAPIADKSTPLENDGNGRWSGIFESTIANHNQYYLMQLGWPLIPEDQDDQHQSPPESPAIFGKPFIVQVSPSPDGQQASVYIPATSPAGAGGEASKGAPAVFHLEASAAEVHLIRGGREALFRFDQFPYWKLFSFEKDAWVPLPWNLDRSLITGNLDSIFVLDLDTLQLSKYRMPDLRLVSTVRLPRAGYVALLAGCDSANAPVHALIANDNGISIDPQTLQRRDPVRPPPSSLPMSPDQATEDGKPWHLISGDGLAVVSFGRRYNHEALHYNTDTRGLELPYLGASDGNYGTAPGVTAGFGIEDGLFCIDSPGGEKQQEGPVDAAWTNAPMELSENSPILFRLLDPQQSGRGSWQLGCFAFFSPIPFAECDLQEYSGGMPRDLWQRQRWAFFDPYSCQLGTLNPDRTTWIIRKLPTSTGEQPVLLNWPETTVARGGAFQFKPLLAGGSAFSAEVKDETPAAAVPVASGILRLPISIQEFSTLRLMDFKVPGKDGSEISYPMLIHVEGPDLPFATQAAGDSTGLGTKGTDLATLGTSHEEYLPLAASIVRLPAPITDLPGTVGDNAVLVSASTNHVYFLSLTTHQITGTIPVAPGALFFPGSGALMEYDQVKRTISRIQVPSGIVEQVLPFPSGVDLTGIGVGPDPGSPVTLVVSLTQLQAWIRFAEITVTPYSMSTAAGTITDSTVQNRCVVLDGMTLKAGGRTQPVLLSDYLGSSAQGNMEDYLWRLQGINGMPSPLATSRNGGMVTLADAFLVLGRNYAVVYPSAQSQPTTSVGSTMAPGGSISGQMAVESSTPYQVMGVTPSGRYQLCRTQNGGYIGDSLDIVDTESTQPLMRLGRLPFLNNIPASGLSHRLMAVLGDKGPLAIIGGEGQTLELVDLNIPEVTKAVDPEAFHVTSQPIPLVMEGTSMQYQVEVNNPSVVQSYHLRGTVPGCTLSPNGLLTYQAPRKISGPTSVMVSIEIDGKSGQSVLHEFPIYVLPWPRPYPAEGKNQL